LLDQPGKRAAAGDFDIVRVGPDGDHIQRLGERLAHRSSSIGDRTSP
jgi:hypothetical protein